MCKYLVVTKKNFNSGRILLNCSEQEQDGIVSGLYLLAIKRLLLSV